MSNKRLIFLLIGCYSFIYRNCVFSDFAIENLPVWIKSQIDDDLSYFKEKEISLRALNDFFENYSEECLLVKITIKDNKIATTYKFSGKENLYRVDPYVQTITKLSHLVALPDTTFLLSIHDGCGATYFRQVNVHADCEDLPVFGMCKTKEDTNVILLPDHEVLNAKYQVLKIHDITQVQIDWMKKYSKLIWRGSTAQGHKMTLANLNEFSRVKLCTLSTQFRNFIDAKFTLFLQVEPETAVFLGMFKGKWISFDQQVKYKYHILIDGNTCAYTNSCWKLFTNSLIFKPRSPWFQWYYNAMEPFVHYVPVQADLSDLIYMLQWAYSHDDEAKTLAANAREFAIHNLTDENSQIYLLHALRCYSALTFVE